MSTAIDNDYTERKVVTGIERRMVAADNSTYTNSG
jgi:hypothetical protein